MSPSARRLRANLLLLACAAIWGFAFVAQVVGGHVGAFTFNATRFAIGAASLLPIVAWLDIRGGVTRDEGRRRWRAALVPGLVCGGFLYGGSSLQQLGLESTTAGNAAFVTGLYVVLVPLAGLLLFRHRTTRATWIGVALAVVGLWLLTVTDDLAVNPGDALNLAGTAFWTAHIIAIGHFARRLDVLRLSVAQFAANAAYAAATAFVVEESPFVGVPDAVGPILYAGVISVGVAYTLQVVGQADALPSHASMIMSLEAMFGAIGGALFLGEVMSGRGYIGAALMMTGILVAQLPAGAEPDAVLVPVPEPPSTALQEG